MHLLSFLLLLLMSSEIQLLRQCNNCYLNLLKCSEPVPLPLEVLWALNSFISVSIISLLGLTAPFDVFGNFPNQLEVLSHLNAAVRQMYVEDFCCIVPAHFLYYKTATAEKLFSSKTEV